MSGPDSPRSPVLEATFAPPAERRSVLDRAHVGDIEGALGTVSLFDAPARRRLRPRLATLLAVMGPGLVVMVADNDAGGLAVYGEAGQNYGVSLLWVLLLLAPVLFINQEMASRLGAVSGAGHARLIVERFGRRWGAFAICDLLVLNALTLVTDFIGVALALGFFGVGRFLAVPIAAIILIAVSATGSFRRWERVMYVLVAASCAVVPLAIMSYGHRDGGLGASASGDLGGATATSASVLIIVAIAGTTVSPWQLFFHQSNVVDKRITPRWLRYERLDTLIGTILVIGGAVAVMLACAWAFEGSSLHGAFRDSGKVATGLQTTVSPVAGTLFALLLMNASILGAAAVSLSSSYAVGDFFGYRHSLHRPWREARFFHGTTAAMIVIAAAVVLLPGIPLGLVTTGVQALAGILLPSATMFALLLCNDRDVLGPWVNAPWLNAVSSVVLAALVSLSLTLTVTILFPTANVAHLCLVLGGTLGVILAVAAVASTRGSTSRTEYSAWDRQNWTMPPLESLPLPRRSALHGVVLAVLRAQILVASVLLLVKLAGLAIDA